MTHPLFSEELLNKGCQPIDLGPDSTFDPKLEDLDRYIHRVRKNQIGFGGYLERRSIYQMSEVFKLGREYRDYHLGMDVWLEAGTNVLAPWKAKVHSFKDNSAFGDYGPTIILEHDLGDKTIYGLYGHLSRESLNGKEVGQEINQGVAFARLGNKAENVGWPPHLHFQLINDIGSYQGDFPGVCSHSELDSFRKNCPDPLSFKGLLGF